MSLNTDCSIGGLKWTIVGADENLVQSVLRRYTDLPELVAKILVARGIALDQTDEFLNPTLKKNLPNPLTLKDMEKAANRMAVSIVAGEPIGIMGDYDVDGATSTAVLKMFLTSIGTRVYTFIPEREDGYGPNSEKMKEFKDKGCKVVATLDCGMTAFEPIAEGKKLGLDVIVLDHHNPEKSLPQAYAIVNPKRLDEPADHPCHNMAAVGVVFLFTVALNTILRDKHFYDDKRPEPNLIKYLDLVAFGTVCDVMKLQGVNRLFVKSGLKQMRKQENKGLNALAIQANLSEPPETYHLGYILGPRINACGRVGQSDLGMQLLSCTDSVMADTLAVRLNELNEKRRDIERLVMEEALLQAEQKPDTDSFILVKGENWHQGVIGIVAGRLKDKYNLPVFALSIEGDDVKGSSRSVPGIDLGSLVIKALNDRILSRGGGHPMAAGFSLRRDKLDDFYHYLQQNITPDKMADAIPTLTIDGVINITGATAELVDKINLLSPFGEGNPEPCFIIPDVSIDYTRQLQNGHISCTLKGRSGATLNAIAFRVADTPIGQHLLSSKGQFFNVAGILKQDSRYGSKRVQFQILDISKAL